MTQTALRPVPIFKASLGDACPRCRRVMTVARQEDFEVLNCVCGHSCKQQTGEMKLEYAQQVLERTAQKRGQQ